MCLSYRKGEKDFAGQARGIMEAMRCLEKSCRRKQCASKFSTRSESLETESRESVGEGTAGYPVCAGLQVAAQAKEVLLYYCQRVFEKQSSYKLHFWLPCNKNNNWHENTNRCENYLGTLGARCSCNKLSQASDLKQLLHELGVLLGGRLLPWPRWGSQHHTDKYGSGSLGSQWSRNSGSRKFSIRWW